MSMMHTNRVNLLFVTLNTVRSTNIISEKPRFSGLSISIQDTASQQARGNSLQITMDGVIVLSFHLLLYDTQPSL